MSEAAVEPAPGGNDMVAKAATTMAALLAGFAAQRALQAGWRMATGKPAPGADDDEVSLGEILVFTALSAAAVAVIRVWATRSTRKVVARRRQG